MEVPVEQELPSRPAGYASWLLTQTAAHASRMISAAFAASGARGYHYRVLAALDELGPLSQAGLSRSTGIHVSDIVATVNELVSAHLVDRAPDLSDRRRNVISLTGSGRRRLDRLDKRVRAVQEDLLAPLSEPERRQLHGLLSRLLSYHGTHQTN